MKRVVYLLLLFVFAIVQVQAQGISFMPKAGLNLANMTKVDGNVRAGINIGAGVEFGITPMFAIESGLFYSMQGAEDEALGIKGTIKNDYLNIPVLAKVYVYEGLNFFAGPQLGFLVNAKGKLQENKASIQSDMKDYYNKVDFGLTLGAGYVTPIGLLFSISYNIGFANVLNDAGQSLFGIESSKNSVFQFNVGWKFSL